MSETILLGAGASVEAGLPTSVELTRRILEKLGGGDEADQACRELLRFVVDKLGERSPRHDSSDGDAVDVETLYRAIDEAYYDDEGSILPSIVTEWLSGFEKLKERYDGLSPHTSPQSRMRRQLPELLWVEDVRSVGYLRPLVRHAYERGVTIVSLNYDNAVELACEAEGLPVETGLEVWRTSGGFGFGANCVRLLKLHGSIDWCREIPKGADPRPPSRFVWRQCTRKEMLQKVREGRTQNPAVIVGPRNKLDYRGPFLDLYAAFRDALNRTSTLTVIGHSFGDLHIEWLIGCWIGAQDGRRLRVVGPDADYHDRWFENYFTMDYAPGVMVEQGPGNRRVSIERSSAGDYAKSLSNRGMNR